MELLTGRLKREHQTLVCMTGVYCEDHHDQPAGELCDSCAGLMKYSETRLAKCPYGQAKPTCAKCPIHSYKKQQREQVQQLMRYAGPRMITKHPVMAVRHLLDGVKKPPAHS
jgi:hypothetical protein